jgi:hypothetical protein
MFVNKKIQNFFPRFNILYFLQLSGGLYGWSPFEQRFALIFLSCPGIIVSFLPLLETAGEDFWPLDGEGWGGVGKNDMG